jgi:tetratricopeptide (TPR) repeat protein
MSGKVTVDDGTSLTDPAQIQSICKGQKHVEAYTDGKGNFSFEFGKGRSQYLADAVDSDMGAQGSRANAIQDWKDCELQASLPGFTSQVIELRASEGFETIDVGRIVLHRLARVEGFTISATSANAPDKAKKAFNKGRENELKSKSDAAQKEFEKAVTIYPKYAVAWVALGQVQRKNNQTEQAQESLRHAIEADPRLVSAYQELAIIALHQKNWQALVTQSDAVLKLNPINFPLDWFFNSLGNYHLQKFDAAEKSARAGMKADTDHQLPKTEYLLGLILAQKHNYPEAAEHLRNYLQAVPNASDREIVEKQLAQLDGLAPRATAAAPK